MPIEKVVKRTTFAQSDRDDREYWLCRTPAERTAALSPNRTCSITMFRAYCDAIRLASVSTPFSASHNRCPNSFRRRP